MRLVSTCVKIRPDGEIVESLVLDRRGDQSRTLRIGAFDYPPLGKVGKPFTAGSVPWGRSIPQDILSFLLNRTPKSIIWGRGFLQRNLTPVALANLVLAKYVRLGCPVQPHRSLILRSSMINWDGASRPTFTTQTPSEDPILHEAMRWWEGLQDAAMRTLPKVDYEVEQQLDSWRKLLKKDPNTVICWL